MFTTKSFLEEFKSTINLILNPNTSEYELNRLLSSDNEDSNINAFIPLFPNGSE